MSDIHRRFFALFLMEQDGRQLSPAQRLELEAHLSACPDCRADQLTYHGLHAQAGRIWPERLAPLALDKVLRKAQPGAQLRWMSLPLRAVLWVGLVLLALVLVQWVFTHLGPAPAVLPPGSPTPAEPVPEATPTASVNEAGKLPVEPILQGEPAGQGIWSPGGDHLFLPLLEIPIPGSDRRSTSLHFISANSGEDCPATETFLGSQGSQQNYAWLDDERVLFIDRQGRALLFTRCQPGSEDLSARFDEPLLRVAQQLDLSLPAPQGPLLLEAPSAYWLLDRATLEARPLAEPVPSSDLDPAVLQTRTQTDPIPTLDLADSFAWPPSGHQVSVLQPVPGRPGLSRLVLIDLQSGQVTRSLEIEAGNEGRAPFAEWLGPDRLMVWSMDAAGPLLVDLSLDPPRQVRVMPELFGLDLVYPDQMSSIGSFYDPASGSYHIVAHVNLQEDRSIYLYHGETGQVVQLDGDRQVLMILPGGQRMPLAALQDVPNYDDSYDLVWVDAPDRPQGHLQVAGHTPRGYPNLQSRLLPGSSILFGSTQGISLVGLPGGETLAFWRLVGAETATLPSMSVAPDGRSLLVTAHLESSPEGKNQGALLYWIPLDAPGAGSSP